MDKDYYKVLGLGRDATAAQIKSAYRKLAKKYHPDMNPGDASAKKKFEEIGEAYQILGDPEKKRIYDECGAQAFQSGVDPKEYEKAWKQAQEARSSGYGNFGGFGNGSGFENMGNGFHSFHTGGGNFNGNPDDLFGSMFDDLFHHTGSGSARNGNTYYSWSTNGGPEDGYRSAFDNRYDAGSSYGYGANSAPENLDLKSAITISFDEAAFGCQKQIRLSDPSGRNAAQTISVSIPAGIDDGKSVRLKGKGRTDGAGHTGDLLLEIHIAENDSYQRKGQDVYTSAQIPFTTAVFGGEAKLPTLYGDVLVKIPAGTQSGKKIRLRGKGIQKIHQPQNKGDEYVTIEIKVPTDLTPSERRKLHEFQMLYERNRNMKEARRAG